MDDVALIGVHGLERHAALVLDDLGGHLLGEVHEALLALGAVALGVHADVAALVAAAVHGVVGEVLYGVERLAAAANYGAHAGAGEVHQDAAVVAVGDLDLGLHAHALEQAAQEALRVGLDALGVLGLGADGGGGGLGGLLGLLLGARGSFTSSPLSSFATLEYLYNIVSSSNLNTYSKFTG